MKCFKCGIEEGALVTNANSNVPHPVQIIKHHISYNPEAVVDCCLSCHKKLHNRVRKMDACPLSPKEVHKLSHKSSSSRYYKKAMEIINFYEWLMPSVRLHEHLEYNKLTGTVTWSAGFEAREGKCLYILQEMV